MILYLMLWGVSSYSGESAGLVLSFPINHFSFDKTLNNLCF